MFLCKKPSLYAVHRVSHTFLKNVFTRSLFFFTRSLFFCTPSLFFFTHQFNTARNTPDFAPDASKTNCAQPRRKQTLSKTQISACAHLCARFSSADVRKRAPATVQRFDFSTQPKSPRTKHRRIWLYGRCLIYVGPLFCSVNLPNR